MDAQTIIRPTIKKRRIILWSQLATKTTAEYFYTSTNQQARAAHNLLRVNKFELLTICSEWASLNYSRSARSKQVWVAHDLLGVSKIELLTICSEWIRSSYSQSARSEQYQAAYDLFETSNIELLIHNYIVHAMYLSWNIMLNNLCG